MDVAKVKARRQAVIDYHKKRESIPESPMSAQHPDMRNRDGSQKILHSTRLVTIQDDDRIYVVEPDADVVRSALSEWLSKREDNRASSNVEQFATKSARRVSALTGDMDLGTQEWNGCLYALMEMGVPVVSTDLVSKLE